MAALAKGAHNLATLGSPPELHIPRARVSDLIFDDLAEKIRTIELIPGQSISESEFAAYYGVSRTPVRAAIAALADHDMVRVTPQVGTRVSYIDFAEVEQAQFIRESLEVNALRYACEAPDRDFSSILRVLEQQRALAHAGDPESFFRSDEEFHRATFVLAGFGGTWSVVGRSRFQLDRIRRLSIGLTPPEKLVQLCDEHETLVSYLQDRDAENAVAYLKHHIRRYIIESQDLQRAYPDYFVGHPPNTDL